MVLRAGARLKKDVRSTNAGCTLCSAGTIVARSGQFHVKKVALVLFEVARFLVKSISITLQLISGNMSPTIYTSRLITTSGPDTVVWPVIGLPFKHLYL